MKLQDAKSQLEDRILPLNGVQGIGVVLDSAGKEIIEVSVSDEKAKKIVFSKIESDFQHLAKCISIVIARPTEFH